MRSPYTNVCTVHRHILGSFSNNPNGWGKQQWLNEDMNDWAVAENTTIQTQNLKWKLYKAAGCRKAGAFWKFLQLKNTFFYWWCHASQNKTTHKGVYTHKITTTSHPLPSFTHTHADTHPFIPVFQDRTWRPASPPNSSKVSGWIVCARCFVPASISWSRTVASVTVWMFPCLLCLYPCQCQKFHQDKISDSTPASCLQHSYVWRWRTERGKERRREETRCQQAVSMQACLPFFPQTLLPFSSLSFPPLSRLSCAHTQTCFISHLFSNRVCCQLVVVGQRQTVDWTVRFYKPIISLEFTQATPACKLSLTRTYAHARTHKHAP